MNNGTLSPTAAIICAILACILIVAGLRYVMKKDGKADDFRAGRIFFATLIGIVVFLLPLAIGVYFQPTWRPAPLVGGAIGYVLLHLIGVRYVKKKNGAEPAATDNAV